jgi:M6 family metalloprotease-like protein
MRKGFTGAQGAQNVLLSPLRLLAAIFVSSLLLSGVFAQGNSASHESPRAAQVRALSNSLLQLHGQVQENPSSATSVRGQAANVLARRAAALQALIQEDPHAALTFALTPELLADLAAKFPGSAGLLETHVTLSGAVEHWVADSADMKSSKESWFLNAGSNRLELHFGRGQHPGPDFSPTVTIEGVQLGSHLAVSKLSSLPPSGSFVIPRGVFGARNLSSLFAILLVAIAIKVARKLRARSATSAIFGLARQGAVCCLALLVVVLSPIGAGAQTCSTTGVQNVAVLVVTFPGVSVPAFSPSLYDQFFGAAPSLNTYWQEASYGLTSATGNVFGPFTLTGAYTCSNLNALSDDAIVAASAAGVDFNTYNRVEIWYPDLSPSCPWTAVSSVGCSVQTTSAGTFNVSASWFPWPKLADSSGKFNSAALSVIFHENGHQLGLDHAHWIKFPDTSPQQVLGPLTDTGSVAEYGDNYSAMGAGIEGHYAAGHKADRLGWLTAGSTLQNVTTSGTYSIQPYELQTGGTRALKIQRGTNNPGSYLWVEYRQPIGNYDPTLAYAYLPNGNVFSGALIHYESPVTANIDAWGTYLLDFTIPDTYGDFPALLPGQTWTDPYSDLQLTVASATASGLTVRVGYSGSGATTCTSTAPSVVASPLNPSIYPGQTANYAVTVTNNDSSTCASNTINLGSSEPSGWSTSFSSSSVTLGPGQSANVTMGKGAPNGTPAGTYAVNMTASNTVATGTDTANATVVTPPSLAATMSVAGTGFTRPGTVPMTASVTNGGAPAAGASVTFTVKTPNGSTASQTATTGSNGVATWNYKLSNKSQVGTYSVIAQAALSSGSRKSAVTQSVSSNTVTFGVQ